MIRRYINKSIAIVAAMFTIEAEAQVLFDIDALRLSSSPTAEGVTSFNHRNIVRNAYWGLGTNLSQCAFDDVIVKDLDSSVRFRDSFVTNKVEWIYRGGTWSITNGRLVQTNQKSSEATEICYLQTGGDCTIEFNAIKNGGTNGFVFMFSFTDTDNFVRWNIGCDNNTTSRVEQSTDGQLTTLASSDMSLQTNRSYAMKAQMNGDYVTLSIDGVKVHEIVLPDPADLSASASLSADGKTIDILITNPTDIQQSVTLRLHNSDIESAMTITDDEYGHAEYPITLLDATGLNTSVAASSCTRIRLLLQEPIITSITSPAPSTRDQKPDVRDSGTYNLSGRPINSGYRGIVIKNGTKHLRK